MISARYAVMFLNKDKSSTFYFIVDPDTDLASECDELYLSGVFYNSTYKLKSAVDTRLETCGFVGKSSQAIGKIITLSGDLSLLIPSCITSNRKLKPEVTGHRTRLHLYPERNLFV